LIIQEQAVKEWKFIQTQLKTISIGGGIQGTDQYSGQPILNISLYEDIEEEGGIEEVDTHLYHSTIERMNDDGIRYKANKTMKEIINALKTSEN
ncbi:MAG: hypothetical protein EZS28_012465, partial [Streblomastix strix]